MNVKEKKLNDILLELAEARKLVFKPTPKGQFLKFSQSIHDEVRKGTIYRLKSPLTVFWALTDSCNLCCEYCYAAPHRNSSKHLPIKECIELIDELSELEVCELIIEGGEPLLHPFFFEILAYIKKRNISVTILTNGTYLDVSVIKKLVKLLDRKYDTIQISIDGDEEITNQLRGQVIYQKILLNLSRMRKDKIEWENMIINCVISKKNFNHIGGMCTDLIEKTNVRKVHFSPVFEVGNGVGKELPAYREAYGEYIKIIKKYGQEIEFNGCFIPDSVFLGNNLVWESMEKDKIILGCCAGRSKLFIAPDGRCYPCTFLRRKEYEVGRFPEQSIKCIWERLDGLNYIQTSYKIALEMQAERKYKKYCAMTRLIEEKGN